MCVSKRRGVEVCKRLGIAGAGRRAVDGHRSTQFSKEHSKVRKTKHAARASLPPVVLDHVSQLDDELSLLVLLTALKRVFIFPSQGGFTVFTVDISHSM